MNTTPRFALANLSNTKNDSFKSKIFQNIHSNFKNPEQQRTNLNETPYSKGPNLKHHDFFSENNDFLNFESKFGSTYDIKEVFS